ncbi:hypothetical protein [Leisingera sp. ANG-Vp]|uniref:hypothetical protein n=1 Tax=Leisingera sp. ANG-Vp TaxID=1577896 RepID=UPI00126A1614|nr:hypothetical protein [Leisingera sp. ANG-Vp]
MPNTLSANSSVSGATESLVFLFVSYVAGEALMLMGMKAQHKSPVHLMRFATIKFVQTEGNEVWLQQFSEAERKFELFSGLAITILLLGGSIGLNSFLSFEWLYGVLFSIGGVVFACMSFSFAQDAYDGFSELMNAVDEFRSRDADRKMHEAERSYSDGGRTNTQETL